jgi:hypothetical protein
MQTPIARPRARIEPLVIRQQTDQQQACRGQKAGAVRHDRLAVDVVEQRRAQQDQAGADARERLAREEAAASVDHEHAEDAVERRSSRYRRNVERLEAGRPRRAMREQHIQMHSQEEWRPQQARTDRPRAGLESGRGRAGDAVVRKRLGAEIKAAVDQRRAQLGIVKGWVPAPVIGRPVAQAHQQRIERDERQ